MGTVQPQLSGPRLSGPSIIWTCSSAANTLLRMHKGRGRWSLGVWQQLIKAHGCPADLSWHKLINLCTCMNAADHDHPI